MGIQAMSKTPRSPLATTHPELAAEAVGWDPMTVTAGSHKKLKWKCSNNHTWFAEVKNRTNRKSNCPQCPRVQKPRVSILSFSQ
ncbi:MAG: hypothetical protein EBU84_21530, partial [Actinobacteria bacterium]|nr:hypothetical protein [Actinomycetota bacterium]